MRSVRSRILATTLGATAAAFVLLVNDGSSHDRSSALVAAAQARVGRPLTPMSYAGVARRTTRRTYAAGAYAGTAAVAVPRAGCYQAVNSYGQVFWRCR